MEIGDKQGGDSVCVCVCVCVGGEDSIQEMVRLKRSVN